MEDHWKIMDLRWNFIDLQINNEVRDSQKVNNGLSNDDSGTDEKMVPRIAKLELANMKMLGCLDKGRQLRK